MKKEINNCQPVRFSASTYGVKFGLSDQDLKQYIAKEAKKNERSISSQIKYMCRMYILYIPDKEK